MPLTDEVVVRRRVSRQAQATAERREQILDAATAAFTEHGFNGTSMRDVAARVGMSHTGVLHHYPDKAALLEAVLDRRVARSTSQFDLDSGDGERFLRALVELTRRDVADPTDLQMYQVVAAESLSPTHPAHGYFRRWYEMVRGTVTAALEDLQRRGHYTGGDVDVPTAATIIAGMRDGLNPQWLLDPEAVDLVAAVRAQLRAFTDLEL